MGHRERLAYTEEGEMRAQKIVRFILLGCGIGGMAMGRRWVWIRPELNLARPKDANIWFVGVFFF